MLRDGQFLQEPPVRIGVHYAPSLRDYISTPEELLMQDVLLGKESSSVLKIIGGIFKI